MVIIVLITRNAELPHRTQGTMMPAADSRGASSRGAPPPLLVGRIVAGRMFQVKQAGVPTSPELRGVIPFAE